MKNTKLTMVLRSMVLAVAGVLGFTHTVSAQFVNPLQAPTLYDFLLAILSSLIFILFPVIVLMLVYSGFLFISAQGSPEKLATARRTFLWSLIGGFVILASWAIAQAIQATVAAL